MLNQRQVPTLSLRDFDVLTTRGEFVRALFDGLSEYGFVVIKEHGISQQLINHAYEMSKQLFNLPLETKLKYESGDGQRGYIAFGKETAKGNAHPDLKEYWHVGPELDKSSAYWGLYPKNFWPEEIPEFRRCFSDLYQALNEVANSVLSALEEAMGLEAGFFESITRDGNTVQRLIHYPPLAHIDAGNSIRAAAHADINLMTLLIGATDSGLELLDKDGHWLPVHSEEGEIVIDTGDMMARLTNDTLPATLHRVVNPEDLSRARYSIPFFVHPQNDISLASPPQFGQRKFDDITAGEFLQQRLEENGFGKT